MSHLESALLAKHGTTVHFSAEHLYYNYLRGRILDTVLLNKYTPALAQRLVDDSDDPAVFRALVEQFGLKREQDWKPAEGRSLFKDRRNLHWPIVDIWKEADAAEARLLQSFLKSGTDPVSEEADRQAVNRMRRAMVEKIDRLLAPYLPSAARVGVDPSAKALADTVRSELGTGPFRRTYIREYLSEKYPAWLNEWDAGQYPSDGQTAVRFVTLSPTDAPGARNLEKTVKQVPVRTGVMTRAEAAGELARNVERHGSVVLILNWPDFTSALRVEPGVTGTHAIIARPSPGGKGRVLLQNSWGTKFGDQGTLDVSIEQVLPHVESIEIPFSSP